MPHLQISSHIHADMFIQFECEMKFGDIALLGLVCKLELGFSSLYKHNINLLGEDYFF